MVDFLLFDMASSLCFLRISLPFIKNNGKLFTNRKILAIVVQRKKVKHDQAEHETFK